MLRQLLRDSVIYGVAGILARATLLILLPVYTRFLSPAEIGALDLLAILVSFANVIVALEVAQGFARYYAEELDEQKRRSYAATAFWFTAAAYAVFAAAGLVLAPVIAQVLLGSSAYVLSVRLALLVSWLTGMQLILLSQLRFGLRPSQYVIVSLTQTGLSVLFSIILVVGFRLGLPGVFDGQIVGYGVSAVLGIAFARGSLGMRPNAYQLREMLRFSLPLVPSSVGVYVTQSIDRLSINALMGLAEVGLFGVGYRVAQSVSLLIVGVQLALTPLVYGRYQEPETPEELARIFRYFVVLALLVCCGLSLLAPYLIEILATGQFDASISVIPLLAPALLLSSMYVFAPGLSIVKRTGVTALINLGGAALNTVLNLALIPHFGIAGAASATLLSAASVFGAYMCLSQRTYPVPHRWGGLAVGTLIGVAGVVFERALDADGLIGLVLGAILFAVIAASFLPLGLIRLDELRSARAQIWRRGA